MRERDIFIAALPMNAPERSAYLASACGGDSELRRVVEELLEEHAREQTFFLDVPLSGFLDVPLSGGKVAVDQPVSEKPGTQIGPYKLLQQIGEGGMGVVYMAEQTEPVKRRVALKIIKPGMDSRQVIARFEAERQALSLMDHPNIAKVLDAGTTDSGRPYFVMELVKGQPITQYCDEKHLTPRQRLELLLPVCQAIQHAHQKGIIHRDIKPTNILVAEYDQQPVPKVIDFGVAKATSQTLTEKTMFTGLGQLVGTLEYMSPEQAKVNQLDIDTRSDIYSLGVLLYELLTGSTPFDKQRLHSAAWDEMLRIIREEEPEKPSTRLSSADALPSIAANRNMEPARLGRTVRGELDWIVMKALEKDRGRRYETPSGLAVDIQNYLNDEPVVACPPSAWYRFRKFARRNKRTLATATLLGMTLVIALGAVTGTVGWAMRNRTALEQQVALDRATRQAALKQEVTNALEESSEWFARDKLPEALAAVKRAEGLLASGDATQELHDRTRQWRTDLDMVAQLEDIRLKRVVVQFRPDKFDADGAYREAFREYGVALEAANPLAAAEQIRASKVRDRLVAGMEDWVVMKTTSLNVKQIAGYKKLLAVLRQADPDPWRNQLRELVESRDRKAIEGLARSEKFLAQSPATVHLLAATLDRLESRPLAIDVLRQAQRRHPGDFWINFALANVVDLNRSDEGIAFFRAALALRPENVEVHWLLGYALGQRGHLAEAEALLREALRLAPNDAMVRIHLGAILLDQFRVPEAETVYRECLQAGQDSDLIRIRLGRALHGLGKLAEAEAEYREAIRQWPGSAQSHGALANFLEAQDRLPEAQAEYREAIRLVPKNYLFHLKLGGLLQEAGKLDEAAAEYREAIRLAPNYASPLMLESLLPQRQLAKEAAELREAVRQNPNDAWTRYMLGLNLHSAGKPAEAELELLESVRLQPTNAGAHSLLGEIYTKRATWDKAAAEFTRSLETNPGNVYTWQKCALVRLRSGDVEAYRSACRELLERFTPTDQSTPFTNQVIMTCLLGEGGSNDPQRVRKLVEQALAMPGLERSRVQVTKALLDYRSGRHAEAADVLNRLATATPHGNNNPRVYIVLSMAQHHLGQDAEARAALVRARAMIWLGPRPAAGNWFDSLCTQILCHEAEALLKIDDKKTKLKSTAK